ncbi:MAG: ABC transporter permease subunit [Spirochaetaceae bacterium]|jgi:NitT/TauT family transport system permease protein|nr:ABC transporter permease subunit [Spirochaetaceae bacterium]
MILEADKKDSVLKRIGGIVLTTLFYAFLLTLLSLPGKREVANPLSFGLVISLIWVYYLYQSIRHPEKKQVRDITIGVFVFFILWELTTKTFNTLIQVLYPAPEDVFNIFISDYPLMIRGIFSSLRLLFLGIGIALVSGNLLGLFVGWNNRLRRDFFPIAKVISPIPAMIYTPYLVAIMPSFSSASVAVVALGLFWPTFMGMISNVGAIDRRIIDSARVMAVSTPTMLLRVILPYLIPGIVRNLRIQLSVMFMILMMAEMIGAQSGLGFYIKKYSDYADYTHTVAGIILVGVVITILNSLLSLVEEKTIKWRTV